MENSAETIAAPEKRENTNFFNKVLRIVAYPVSAALGFMVTHTSVRSSNHKTAESAKAFADLDKIYMAERQENVAQRLSGAINTEEFLAKTLQTKRAHGNAMQGRMEELGLDKFANKWRYINRSNKQRAIIEGLTVSGIAIGSLLTIANSKSLSDLFLGESKDDGQKR